MIPYRPVLISTLVAATIAAPAGAATHVRGTAPLALIARGLQLEPADSLWKLGQRAIADEQYDRAASVFATLVSRYPSSEHAGDALYWRAWALVRIGGRSNLERALAELDRQAERYASAPTRSDARSLRARILGDLAKRGDASAAESLATSAKRLGQRGGCGDDDDMRLAALQGLLQMDAETALPILRQVVAKRDECSAPLRRQAVFILSQQRSDEAVEVLLDVARNDPSSDVRREAVGWLGQSRSTRAAAALDSIVTSSTDEQMLDRAIFALSQSGAERASTSLRKIAGDDKRPTAVRTKAVFWLGQTRDRDGTMDFLKDLFRKSTSEDIRGAVIQAVSQNDRTGGAQWLLDVARDKSMDIDTRKNAIFWAGQGRAGLKELIAFYDDVRDDVELRKQAIFVLSQRRENEATDKLMAIASSDADRELRKQAIFWLGQKRDPRVAKFLLDLINR